MEPLVHWLKTSLYSSTTSLDEDGRYGDNEKLLLWTRNQLLDQKSRGGNGGG